MVIKLKQTNQKRFVAETGQLNTVFSCNLDTQKRSLAETGQFKTLFKLAETGQSKQHSV